MDIIFFGKYTIAWQQAVRDAGAHFSPRDIVYAFWPVWLDATGPDAQERIVQKCKENGWGLGDSFCPGAMAGARASLTCKARRITGICSRTATANNVTVGDAMEQQSLAKELHALPQRLIEQRLTVDDLKSKLQGEVPQCR